MRNKFILLVLLVSFLGFQADAQNEHFKATLTADGGDLVVSLMPFGGNITVEFLQIEFFIRTSDITTSFTMGAPQVNTTNFPGNIPIGLVADNINGAWRQFGFGYPQTGSLTSSTYTVGVEYELARMSLSGGAPNLADFELYALLDGSDGYLSYLNIQNASAQDLAVTKCLFVGCPTESSFYGDAVVGSGPALHTEGQTNVPLPVEMSSFIGWNDDKVNILKWRTETEENASHFEVERSITGDVFERLGQVNATGNSATPITYDFVDNSPSVGLNYYRLKIVDLDGSFEYSDIVRINVEGDKTTIKGFPNPFEQSISFELFANENGNARFEVFDITGKQVYYTEKAMDKGLSTLSLDLNNLASGVYFVRILLPGTNEYLSSKVIKE